MNCPHPLVATARRVTLLAVALALLAGVSSPPQGLAQGADKKAKLLFSDRPNDPNPKDDLVLRPNLLQPVYVFVKVPEDVKNPKASEEFTVEVRSADDPVDGGIVKVAAAAGKTTRVVFGAAAPAAAPGTTPAPAKEPVLSALPGATEIRLLSGTTIVQTVKVIVAKPAEYIEVKSVKYDPNEKAGVKNRLTVDVQASEAFTGPRCWTELVVSPDRVPGLIEGRKGDSNFRGSLSKPGDKLTLVAENLQFAPGAAGKSGLVYLNIDGYPRAYTFYITFVASGTPSTGDPVKQPMLRINGRTFAPPTGGYPVSVEIDNSDGKTAELSLGKAGAADGENADIETVTFVGDRRERLMFAAGPRGALLFKPEVQDWGTEMDVRDVFGKRALRLRLLDAEKNAVEVLNSRLLAEGKDREARVKEVIEPIFLDATPPEDITFVKDAFPKSLERGSILRAKATAKEPESEIKSAVFYVGKPAADGKLPDNAVPAEVKFDEKNRVWVATGDVPVPTDQRGISDLSVRFTNSAGLSATETIRIQLVDPGRGGGGADGGAGGPKLASVAGTVTEGDRPQPNLEVSLRDEKNNLKASTTTDAAGKFLFKDVLPGAYKVVSAKPVGKTRGETPVSVAPDDKKTGVAVKLVREGNR